MSESTNIPTTAPAAPVGSVCAAAPCQAPKPAQPQAASPAPTAPPTQKGFKRQGRKQH